MRQALGGVALETRLFEQYALEAVQRLAERELEKFVLRCDVVVDRRLGQTESCGQHAHGGGVVAELVERCDRDLQDSLLVVPRTPAPHTRLCHEPTLRDRSVFAGMACRIRQKSSDRPAGQRQRRS